MSQYTNCSKTAITLNVISYFFDLKLVALLLYFDNGDRNKLQD